jgi:hypothetical protein
MRMPWGKHKGIRIDDLPDSYVLWLMFQAELREMDLIDALRDEVLYRWPDRCPVKYVRGSLTDSITDKAKRIYRELSLMFHPDKGGNVEAMKAVNLFYERLQ